MCVMGCWFVLLVRAVCVGRLVSPVGICGEVSPSAFLTSVSQRGAGRGVFGGSPLASGSGGNVTAFGVLREKRKSSRMRQAEEKR